MPSKIQYFEELLITYTMGETTGKRPETGLGVVLYPSTDTNMYTRPTYSAKSTPDIPDQRSQFPVILYCTRSATSTAATSMRKR